MKNRLTELDGLRGLAAFFVVTFHYLYLYDFLYEHEIYFPAWIEYGYLGVHLFFMISGFVIFWTVSRSSNPIDFLWSRFSRLFPTYWAAVTITFIAVSYFGLPNKTTTLNEYLINLTMLQDFLWVKTVDGSYWSLALELSFYFWIAFILLIKQLKKIDAILIFWIIMGFIIAQYYVGKSTSDMIHHRHPILIIFVIKYIALFSSGIAFYKIWIKTYSTSTIFVLIASIISIILSESIIVSSILISFFFIFFLIINNKFSILSYKPLTFLGYISYSFYLIHQNIGYIIIQAFYNNNISSYLGVFVAIVFSMIIAYVLTRFIEQPSLKLLRGAYKKGFTAPLFKG